MNILGLDLGTKTGFAYNIGDEFYAGTWILATTKEIRESGKSRLNRRNDPRIKKFCEILSGLPEFDVVIYEDIQFASYTLQVQLWSSLRATVWLCSKFKYIDCVPVATLKKFAIYGNATKYDMASALKKKHPDIWNDTLKEDTVDAIWLFLWAKQNLTRTNIIGCITS